jgi:hypothetical protein
MLAYTYDRLGSPFAENGQRWPRADGQLLEQVSTKAAVRAASAFTGVRWPDERSQNRTFKR